MRLPASIAVLGLFLAGCAKEQMGDCFVSTGPHASEERVVGGFRSIALDDRVALVITQDSSVTSPQVTVEGGRDLLPRVVTEVRGDRLYIGSDLRCNWVRDLKQVPRVHVTLSALDELVYSSVGDVETTTAITGTTFRLEQWDGHGTVRLHLEVDTCWLGMHTGVGDVVVTGSTHTAFLYAANFAHIDGRDLQAQQVFVNNSGSGDIRCRAEDAAFVQIRALGDVYLGGAPPVLDLQRTGAGRLIAVP